MVTIHNILYCRESAGTEPVVFKVVQVTGCCLFRYHHGPMNVRLSFPTTTIIATWWACAYRMFLHFAVVNWNCGISAVWYPWNFRTTYCCAVLVNVTCFRTDPVTAGRGATLKFSASTTTVQGLSWVGVSFSFRQYGRNRGNYAS